MKTKVLLAICAVFLPGTGFALTPEPNIINGTFEEPVLSTGLNSDPDVYYWIEAEDISNIYSRVNTRRYGPGNWSAGSRGVQIFIGT